MNETTYDCDCRRLEPFKRDAAFGDIRKGDVVRMEYARGDLTVTRTGIAHILSDEEGIWATADDGFLCSDYSHRYGGTITILSRPEPELPTTPGAVIKIWLGEEWMRVNLGADGYWRGAWPNGDDMEATGDELIDVCGTYWDRFEVVA